MHRRTFLLSAGASGLAWGANERIRIAVIGLGGRGQNHLDEYMKQPNCQVAAVCDVDSARLERAEAKVLKQSGVKPKTLRDMRRAFDDKDIDAVSMVTPNHWHALSTVWACQAGKDVYSEKPASHNIFEGRKMVEAARKYKRIVQVGHQSRSISHKIEAIGELRKGAIGQIYMAKGLCFKRRMSIGKKPDGPVPPGVDFDLWRGPAQMRPFNENRFHYNWHWFWDTGNGDIGNQGVHEMDIARWGLGQTGHPKSVVSTGGKFVYDDDQETANTQTATYDYGNVQLVFEVRGLVTGPEAWLEPRGANTIGNIFFGSDGWMIIDSEVYKIFKGEKRELVKESAQKEGTWNTAPHIANFLASIRSRKHTDLNCDIEQGHLSASLCHLGNISYRLQRRLEFDGARERFKADAEADRMLTRDYRAPYVVPSQV